ncbi:hypothetical protein [Nocardia sp. NPDC052566]|uniref:hypothetical protein n=1 Tax=Nocardia sp. NPDC052566 TaxID=3364330 RepID=UPI0037C79B84
MGSSANPQSKSETVADLRQRMAAVKARGVEDRSSVPDWSTRAMLPIPAAIAQLLPGRGLAGGTLVDYRGATSVLLGIAAATTASGYAALVNMPNASLLAAVEMGAQLERLPCVTARHEGFVPALGALLDGMALVIADTGNRKLTPTELRGLRARAHSKGCTLILSGAYHHVGADLRIVSRVIAVDGLGAGSGRVTSTRIAIHATAKFGTGEGQVQLAGRVGRVEWTSYTDPTTDVAVFATDAG